jgi:argininosuccinate synthase
MSDIKRVVLAYSGGLDTSVILKWLQVTYNCEVVTFTADLGQGEELGPARAKAELMGVKPEHIYIDDLREEFVRDFVFPMMRANARYEGDYLLGTSIARPLISKRLIEIARETGADAVSHGATGKGNDQVRFELSAYALEPGIKVIARGVVGPDQPHRADRLGRAAPDPRPQGQARRAPSPPTPTCCTPRRRARFWKIRGRKCRITYTAARSTPRMLGPARIYRDRVREGRRRCPERRAIACHAAGCPERSGPQAWHRRLDLVENRFVGMKSRGMYDAGRRRSMPARIAASNRSRWIAARLTSRMS